MKCNNFFLFRLRFSTFYNALSKVLKLILNKMALDRYLTIKISENIRRFDVILTSVYRIES